MVSRGSARKGTRRAGRSRIVRRVKPRSLYKGAPYAYASVVSHGALVFTAGACPLDATGRTVGRGDVKLQAHRAVRNLFSALTAAGSSPDLVLKTTVYVASRRRADLVAAWNVVQSAFGDVDPPSTLVGVAALGYPEQLVEIEAVAALQP
jgi:enamine deaminase RidA (YjgF/YER057c/UK114 family)